LGGADVLDGGEGNDTLVGGLGDDLYFVDSTDDVLIELENEGHDSVLSNVTYVLSDNIESLTLIGASAIDGDGNSQSNAITGNDNSNVLHGLAGDDILNGGQGEDTLIGGLGDDTYIIDDENDVIIENEDEGSDSVGASVTFTISSGVENIQLVGTAAIDGTGNALDNILIGNIGANVLSGLAGADTLIGGSGNDTQTGGTESDTFVFHAGFGIDTITDFVAGAGSDDLIEFDASFFADFNAIMAAAFTSGANTVITLDASNTLTLQNVILSSLHQDDFRLV
jgi:serralysin